MNFNFLLSKLKNRNTNTKKRGLFFLLFLTIPASVQALRLLTLNVENFWSQKSEASFRLSECPPSYCGNNSYKHHLSIKKNRILSLLKDLDADLICLNEVEITNQGSPLIPFLKKHLPHYEIVGIPHLPPQTRLRGNLLLSRFPIERFDAYETKDLNQETIPNPRALWAQIHYAHATWHLYCAHWTSRFHKKKHLTLKKQFESMSFFTQPSPYPEILMGDLNSTLHNPPLKELLKAGWRRPFQNPNACTYWYRNRCQQFDHILVRNTSLSGWLRVIQNTSSFSLLNGNRMPLRWQIKRFKKNRIKHIGQGFSDHLPLLFTQNLEEDPPIKRVCATKPEDFWKNFTHPQCVHLSWKKDLPLLKKRGLYWGFFLKDQFVRLRLPQKPFRISSESRLLLMKIQKIKGETGWDQGLPTLFLPDQNHIDLVY